MGIDDRVLIIKLQGAPEQEKKSFIGKKGKIVDINMGAEHPYDVRLNNGEIIEVGKDEMKRI